MDNDLTVLNKALGADRAIVTQIDQLRASDFLSAVLSGSNNYTSGQNLSGIVSGNVVKLRPMNIHHQNRESSAMTVVYRDGGITGTIVCGPYIINPTQTLPIAEPDLRGRYFLSGVYAVVISGTFAAGIQVNMGFILEGSDQYE